jgi:predicted nucleotidyltransferase
VPAPATQRFGLKNSTIPAIQLIFALHPEVERVLLYGSRAIGNYCQGSDIDLTLTGDGLTYSLLNRIETEIEDLLLPYGLDLSLFAQIDNRQLIDHIMREGKEFYAHE